MTGPDWSAGGAGWRLGGVSWMMGVPDGGGSGVWAESEFIVKANGTAGSNSNAITPKDVCFIKIPFYQWCFVSGVQECSSLRKSWPRQASCAATVSLSSF
jgi:hypothetical protein